MSTHEVSFPFYLLFLFNSSAPIANRAEENVLKVY